jgi:hypothetical protein
VTTSSGKPPLDEQGLDPKWESGNDASKAGPDSSLDPPTPRQGTPRGDNDAETKPIFGTAVPYGGDDRTEEIDPIALDMPFGAEERRAAASRAAQKTPAAPAAVARALPRRDNEFRAPVTQLVLSDLFDSAPSSAALAPPDPAAFASNRPPAARAPSEPPPALSAYAGSPAVSAGAPSGVLSPHAASPAASSGQGAVIAMPSIDIGAERAVPRHDPAARGPARPPMPTPAPSEPGEETGRRRSSVPTLESVGHPSPQAAPVAAREAHPAGGSSAREALRSNPRAASEPRAALNAGMNPMALSPTGLSPAASSPVGSNPLASSPAASSPAASNPAASNPAASNPAASNPAASNPAASTPEATHPAASNPAASNPAASGTAASNPAASSTAASNPVASTFGLDAATPIPTPAASGPAVGVAAPPARSNPSASAVHGAAAPAANQPLHTAPSAGEPASDPGARFPSDVATSRPPDVMLGKPPFLQAEPRPSRDPRPLMTTVTNPVTSQGSRAQTNLPSIMLGADVEAEPDSASRRAQRAARATVRLELPPGFGRPGSAVPGGAVSGSAMPGSAMPGSGPPPASASFAPAPPSIAYGGARSLVGAAPSWLADPRMKRLAGAALAFMLLILVLALALRSRSGSLVVTALGPGNRAVDDVTIFIDGKPLCDVSPCRIKGLSPGVHTLRAGAPNLASQAEETVEISAGDEATYNIDLLAVAAEVRAGGLRVAASDTPLTLYVDGKRVGRLPQEVSGLSSGKHWIKLDPEDGGAVIEKSVNVLAGETVQVEPKAAKRDKALVTIRLSPGSEGALVTFDDAFLLDFPAELELEPNTVHTLSATKPGYEDLAMDVRVAAGEAEKLVDVSLSPLEPSSAPRKARPKVVRKPAAAKPAAAASAQVADATQGLLNISSVPPSQIILNGRPLGSTPKTGITVPGDSLQTIVFVHPKMGRRRAQKFVPAGKERTVSIRF